MDWDRQPDRCMEATMDRNGNLIGGVGEVSCNDTGGSGGGISGGGNSGTGEGGFGSNPEGGGESTAPSSGAPASGGNDSLGGGGGPIGPSGPSHLGYDRLRLTTTILFAWDSY